MSLIPSSATSFARPAALTVCSSEIPATRRKTLPPLDKVGAFLLAARADLAPRAWPLLFAAIGTGGKLARRLFNLPSKTGFRAAKLRRIGLGGADQDRRGPVHAAFKPHLSQHHGRVFREIAVDLDWAVWRAGLLEIEPVLSADLFGLAAPPQEQDIRSDIRSGVGLEGAVARRLEA